MDQATGNMYRKFHEVWTPPVVLRYASWWTDLLIDTLHPFWGQT